MQPKPHIQKNIEAGNRRIREAGIKAYCALNYSYPDIKRDFKRLNLIDK